MVALGSGAEFNSGPSHRICADTGQVSAPFGPLSASDEWIVRGCVHLFLGTVSGALGGVPTP